MGDRRVESNRAALDLLQDRGCGEGLVDAADAVEHVRGNGITGADIGNARGAYIERLRYTVKTYSRNIKELGELAGIEVHADPVRLENDDVQLSQAGLHVSLQAGAGQQGVWSAQGTYRGFFTQTVYSWQTGTFLQTVHGTISVTV